jgi:radical SAM superfamily enzyme YgiQ (UPF0313 family)
MFKDKKYHVRPLAEILEDIDLAKQYYGSVQQVFLCDGDAISLDMRDLIEILHKLKSTFPDLKEIATYAGPKSTLKKSRAELRLLREAGLTKAYLGVESGDDAVLKATHKGVDAAQMLEAGQNLVSAGMELYAIILIGLAGRERSRENAIATAQIINRMNPAHLSAMTYMPVPGTKMYQDIQEGKFYMSDNGTCLQEMRTLVEHIELDHLHFLSEHVSNHISIDGYLQRDKERILQALDQAIRQEDSLH